MRTHRGDIWSYDRTALIVVPTNIGYRKDGTNVMGAGLAKQLSVLCPDLPAWYGQICRTHKNETPVVINAEARIIFFPVKELDESAPWLSWKNKASLSLIERSTKQLAELEIPSDSQVLVPLVGCGNGGLSPTEVIPLLEKYLKGDRFIIVDQNINTPDYDLLY